MFDTSSTHQAHHDVGGPLAYPARHVGSDERERWGNLSATGLEESQQASHSQPRGYHTSTVQYLVPRTRVDPYPYRTVPGTYQVNGICTVPGSGYQLKRYLVKGEKG